MAHPDSNIDEETVAGFGDEWTTFNQRGLAGAELQETFDAYFRIFPWEVLTADSVGFDVGCGSGRWARLVAQRVGRLHCVDASLDALSVARQTLREHDNCVFHHASLGALPFEAESMDFGYSLGVIHHVPHPAAALRECVAKLRKDAPLLVYLYYALDGRPWWYRLLWSISDRGRRIVSPLPHGPKLVISAAFALAVYWPLARAALAVEWSGGRAESLPLAFYRHRGFYTMRTDAYDRFGTRLEHRFTRDQVRAMLEDAGLTDIRVSDDSPYWCAVGFRR